MRILTTLFCLLLIGCPSSGPQAPPATPQPTKAPVSPTPTAGSAGDFSLRLSSGAAPGWFEVSVDEAGKVNLKWDGGEFFYTLPQEHAVIYQAAASRAVEAMKKQGKPTTPGYIVLTYREAEKVYTYHKGGDTEGEPFLNGLVEQLELVIPQKSGLHGTHAIGTLKHSDLEGGFYQLHYSQGGGEHQLTLNGEVPAELKGQQVLIGGLASDAASIQMSGPTFELNQPIVAWPPKGGFWQGEGIPQGLK